MKILTPVARLRLHLIFCRFPLDVFFEIRHCWRILFRAPCSLRQKLKNIWRVLKQIYRPMVTMWQWSKHPKVTTPTLPVPVPGEGETNG